MISKEDYEKGIRCKGACGICSKMNKCYQFKQEGLSGIKPIFEPLKEPVYEPPENPINNTVINRTAISADTITAILQDDNVESVSINYNRVGEKETLNIDVKRI